MYNIPKGFTIVSAHAGITTKNKKDLGLIISSSECSYSGCFTKNLFPAAPVNYCKSMLGKRVRALIANSGCANACTGKEGMQDISRIVSHFKKRFRIAGNVLMSSTGIIGRRLPVSSICSTVSLLSRDKAASSINQRITAFEEAIMTTDTKMKIFSSFIQDGKQGYSILGFARGSGMIHPDMATMLAFILTDAEITQKVLSRELKNAVDSSFNNLSVDGDTSTNDSVIALANGASGVNISGRNIRYFRKALQECCLNLTEAIAADGEGATKLIEIVVKGLNKEKARTISRTLATSPLVKTAIYGNDPNWGRIIASIGHAGININPYVLKVFIQDVPVFAENKPKKFDGAALSKRLNSKKVIIRIDCGNGNENRFFTCDLTEEYIKINALYRT